MLENSQPVEVLLVDRADTLGVRHGLHPVLYSDDNVQLKFIGDAVNGRFVGSVYDLRSGKVGTWYVVRADIITSDDETALVSLRTIAARVERDRLLAENTMIEDKIRQKQIDRARLQTYLTEGDKLKANADRKYKIESAALSEKEKVLKKRLPEIERLRAQISLAQQLSPVGRLAQLSRETMLREKKWFLESLHE